MRTNLTAAAALAPLCFMVAAHGARATTTVSNGRNTPIATASANNGAPDDVDISTGGSITLTSPSSPAVTLNSNNVVTNEGSIKFTDVDNAIGVLVVGGNTGSFTNTGSILLNESTSPSDTNKDGVVEEPFAQGTGRYGVLVQGASPFVGNITNGSGGSISVTGNNSYGVSVEAPLTGNLTNSGTITVLGDNSVALRETAGVNGNVLVTGPISATGQNSSGVVLSGDVTGRFSVYAAITATGYGTASRSAYDSVQTLIQSTPSELEQGAAAVIVSGNVGGGIFIGAAPTSQTTTNTTSTADVDGDGIADVAEGAGSITSSGQAPALVIGAANRDVSIGAVQFTTGSNPYGLVIAGSVTGAGVYDGVSASAIQIGDASGTGTVHIAGGMLVRGQVATLSYGADATTLHILQGSTVPEVNVAGVISAQVNAPLANTTTGVATPFDGSATAIKIDAGAVVSTLTVAGTIEANVVGDGNGAGAGKINNASVVVDQSGTLSTVNLTGHLVATLTPSLTTITPTGSKTALDLSANTAGVTINMSQAPQSVSTVVTASDNTTTTTITQGPVVQNTTGAAIITSVTSTDGKTVTNTTTPIAPTIVGDIFLGNGPNTFNMLAGTVTGALSMGSGASANVTLDNGAVYVGAFSYTGGGLALNVANGSFTTTNPSTLMATSLNVGATSLLSFAIDPVNGKYTSFVVNGSATIAAGAKLGVNLLSTLTGPETYQLISATNLTVGGADADLASAIPYLFFGQFHSDQAAGTLDLTIRPKTAAEMGLTPGQGAALPAVYNALNTDLPIQQALFAQYDQAGFSHLYNQLLPDYSGGVYRAASAASRTISRLTADPNEIENPTGSRGVWAQQFFVGADKGSGESPAFQAGGFGYVAGVETGGLGFGAVGATAAFVAVNESDPHSPGDNRTSMSELEGGLYWQGETGGLTLDARVGAGFNFFSAKRQFIETDSTGDITLSRQTKASWTGYSLSGRFGAAYQINLGSTFFLRPTLHFDYFRLDQGSYAERFGGNAVDLAYDESAGDEASGTASVIFGAKLGRGLIWRPQLELGVRDVFSGNAGDVIAHFVSGGPTFIVSPEDISGPAGVARLKLKASSEYYEVGIEGGVEARSRYGEGDFKLTVRVLF